MDAGFLRRMGVGLAVVVMAGSVVVWLGDEAARVAGAVVVLVLEGVSFGLLYFCGKE